MELTTSSLVATIITLAYVDWLYLTWINRQNAPIALFRMLVATLGLAIVSSLWNIVPLDNDLPQAEIALYLGSGLLVAYGALTLIYLQFKQWVRPWLVAGGVWWILSTVVGLMDTNFDVNAAGWLSELSLAGFLVLAGWVIIGLATLGLSFYSFYRATLPEIANRALLWAIVTPLVIMGALMGVSGSSGLRELGWLIQVIGFGLVTYSVVAVRALDLRRTMRFLLANAALVLMISIFVLVILVLAEEFNTGDIDEPIFFVGLAIGSAILFSPFFFVIQSIFNRLLGAGFDTVTMELGRFAEAISGTVEMEALAEVVMKSMREVLGVRRAAILLAKPGDDDTRLHLEPYQAVTMGDIPETEGSLAVDGKLYKHLFEARKPILQYELDFAPEYKSVPDLEANFLRYLQMAAFAPIIVQGKPIGVLASGPKANDDRFYRLDLDILSTIGNQTAVAVRNSRLVEDVLRRERDLAESNRRLEVTKRQLEALDSVKTDFITIASHELRTPLAQIRGHTDIIAALNEQGMMDQEQLTGMTNNLRRAADRLEGLIADMLDVSQLDLSAMDLRFVDTTIENAVRMAIEPLQESIRNRRQSLTARGLRDLPPIHADMQRLVQALRNLVLNAVKFTPDGGRIEIVGSQMINPDTAVEEVKISIKDSGIGIDPRNHEAVFEKFFRAFDPGLHSTGTTKFMGAGPGLGLTIAQGVIEGHGGRITVESDGYDPENLPGTTFNVYLPIHPPETGRRMSISSPGVALADIEDDEVFEEANPTLLNPSANRAGMTTALMAAARAAIEEEDSEPD